MKKLLIILTLGLMFGQTKLETRLYEVNFNSISLAYGNTKYINLPDLLGFEGRFIIQPFPNMETDCDDDIYFECEGSGGNIKFSENGLENLFATLNCSEIGTFSEWGDGPILAIGHTISLNGCWDGDMQLWITAEFPDMDTGYMEEDFDFCINEGLNLVSYPCENDIAINDALPSEIANNLTSIVGAGVAGANINGTWVGSLTELEAGSGYWFKSSIEACFNYECAEN